MKSIIIILASITVVGSSWTTPVSLSESVPTNKKVQVKTTLSQNFSFFRTHRQGKGITATWGMLTNNGVTGFIVQRTYEDPSDPYAYWEDLATPDCTSSRSFKYTEAVVFPGYVTYRIVAMNGLSVVDISDISTEHIVQH